MVRDAKRIFRKKTNRVACSSLMILILLGPSRVDASGFRITNQSLGAVGLGGAHIAFTPGPDASYSNPANMSALADQWHVETAVSMLHLPGITYTDARGALFSGTSTQEWFCLPLLHITSPAYDALRFGFSLTYPFGLAKQWEQAFPKAYAERFSLLTVEANPTFSYQFADWLSLGGGIRFVYGRGGIDNEIGPPLSPLVTLDRSSEGTDTGWGYNLAVTVRPNTQWSLATTYRSEVDLDLSGPSEFRAFSGGMPLASFTAESVVPITLPEVFSIAVAYTFERLTVEAGWERTYWSSFKQLDVTYNQPISFAPFAVFDEATKKSWQDSDAYRFGITYRLNELWTTTLGFSVEKTPVPTATLGFELPDADALVYSTGLRYRWSDAMEVGLSYMYHHTRSRTVSEAEGNLANIEGRFTRGGAHVLTLGLITSF